MDWDIWSDRTDAGRRTIHDAELEWLEGTEQCAICRGDFNERGDEDEPQDEKVRCLACRFTLRESKRRKARERGEADDRTETERQVEAMEAIAIDGLEFVDDTFFMETAHTTEAAVQAVADRGAAVAAEGEEFGLHTQGHKCEWTTRVIMDSGRDATVEEVCDCRYHARYRHQNSKKCQNP